MRKKTRTLKDIDLKEVSLVDRPANKQDFLFYKNNGGKPQMFSKKNKINIVIDSDGTAKGTVITLNKEKIKDLRSFNFSLWHTGANDANVSCDYSKLVETDDGFSRSESYYLTKGDSKMHKDIKAQLEKYFGEDEVDFTKAVEDEAVIKSLKTIADYREDFPDDLKDAVGTILKRAALIKKEEEAASEKDSDEDSDEDETEEKSVDADEDPEEEEEEEKEKKPVEKKKTKTKKVDLLKQVATLTEQIDNLEKKQKKSDGLDEVSKALAGLTKRLKAVEEETGVRKSVEGQDSEDSEDGEPMWPSFTKS